jgi:hypothetical protein
MRRFATLTLLLAFISGRASAAPLHLDVHVNLGGHDLDFHVGHGGLLGGLFGGEGLFAGGSLFGGGLFGGGLLEGGFLGLGNFEAQQARFEDKFTDIMSAYDDGVANIENFYASDEYDDVVNDTERLVDRYDWFVTRAERSVDRLGNIIDASNDSLTFVQDLLADYQGRDDLSEKRLARIEDVLTNIEDHIQLKIDFLTEKQTTLSENLPTYQDFQSQLAAYLDEIVAAAGGTTDDGDASAASLRALAATAGGTAGADRAMPTAATSAVPEPSAALLALLAGVALCRLRRPSMRA